MDSEVLSVLSDEDIEYFCLTSGELRGYCASEICFIMVSIQSLQQRDKLRGYIMGSSCKYGALFNSHNFSA
jgi:hypothetical protein